MQVSVQKLEKSQVKAIVELSEKEMEEFREKTAKELQGSVKVAGFRPGKVPTEILVEQIGEQAFLSELLNRAISETYDRAISEQKLRPVAIPKLQILKQEPLKYEAILPVVPEVSFKKEPAKVRLSRKKVEVEKKEIEEVFKNFVQRNMEWKEVERAAQKGDRVELDFEGKDKDGVLVEGASSKNHPVVLGSGALMPGFEDALVGLKKGEEKEFELPVQKKPVKFHVKVKRVEEGKADTLDDAFAKKISADPKKTLEDLKGEIKTELQFQKEHLEDTRLENEFLKELLKIAEAELPEILIEREIDFLVERIKSDLKKRGQNWETYEKELKEKGKELRVELRKPATEQVLIRLSLERLFELENPEVLEEDLEQEIAYQLGFYPPEFHGALKERFREGSQERELLRSGIKLRKVVKAHTKEA